jgi:hypothetical protein
MDFDFSRPVQIFCKVCKKVTAHGLADSTNFGNILAMCDVCESETNYTPVDHRAILREARRGF